MKKMCRLVREVIIVTPVLPVVASRVAIPIIGVALLPPVVPVSTPVVPIACSGTLPPVVLVPPVIPIPRVVPVVTLRAAERLAARQGPAVRSKSVELSDAF